MICWIPLPLQWVSTSKIFSCSCTIMIIYKVDLICVCQTLRRSSLEVIFNKNVRFWLNNWKRYFVSLTRGFGIQRVNSWPEMFKCFKSVNLYSLWLAFANIHQYSLILRESSWLLRETVDGIFATHVRKKEIRQAIFVHPACQFLTFCSDLLSTRSQS